MTNKGKNTKTISMTELDQMIMEEMDRVKKSNSIKAKLAVINEELKRLQEEESVDEVKVGGTKSGSEWYEKGLPVPSFEKKGTHLKEEDPMVDMDAIGEETFEQKLAAIGRELDAKLSSTDDVDAEEGDDDMGIDDMEVVDDSSEEETPESEEDTIDLDGDGEEESDDATEDELEIDEASIEVEKAGDPFDKKAKEGMNKVEDGKSVDESEEECETMDEEEGVVSEEETTLNESRDLSKKGANVLLSKELERMKNLAGLS